MLTLPETLRRKWKSMLLVGTVLGGLLSASSAFAAERERTVLFLSMKDLQLVLSRPSSLALPTYRPHAPGFERQEQSTAAGQESAVVQRLRWSTGPGIDSYTHLGDAPAVGLLTEHPRPERTIRMTPETNAKTQQMVETTLSFGPFRLEATKQLWRGEHCIDLRRQSLALLRYLAERPGQVVTKKELLTQLWSGLYVSPTVVRVCVREIRAALGDDAKQPQFIETLGTQGYRFIASLSTTSPVLPSYLSTPCPKSHGVQDQPLTTDSGKLSTPFVRREDELAQLQKWYARVQQSEPQLIFVSGEAGIGKTSLVERFLAHAKAGEPVRIGRGNCVEQAGPGEAYLPVLQALQQLCRAPDGEQVVAALRRYAPLWLLQLSGVIDADEQEKLQRHVHGSSPHRMVRELAHALKEVTAESPLIFFFDDLQWSDPATLDFIAYLGQAREPIRLLVIGTYRPTDTIVSGSPLHGVVQELNGRRQAQELALELLTQPEVEAYLRHCLAGSPVVEVLGPVIHRRTEGNALFVMHFVDYLLQQDVLVETTGGWELQAEPGVLEELIPANVHQLLLKQIEGFSPEVQHLLAVASVVGPTFTAREAAIVLNRPLEAIEAVYDQLAAQEHLIEARDLAECTNGAVTVRYQFRHTLYQQVLYHRIGLAQQVRWHRQLGEHFATLFGKCTQEIAEEVAVHFERGREYRRAILFRQEAGKDTLQQSAYQQALRHGQVGITLLSQLPATPERAQLELRLRQLVSAALAMSRGFTDEELQEHLHRAQQLGHELHDEGALVSVMIHRTRRSVWHAGRAAVDELAQQEEALAARLTDRQLQLQLHTQLAWIKLLGGKHTSVAEHYDFIRTHYDPHAGQFVFYAFAGDPLVVALGASGVSLSLAGQLEQGWCQVARGLTRAEELRQPAVCTLMLFYAGLVKGLYGAYGEGQLLSQQMLALAHQYELPLLVTLGRLLHGGMAVQQGAPEAGIALLTTGLAQYRAMRVHLFEPYFLSFLAEGYRRQGKVTAALQTVEEALTLTATNLDVFWEAELYRQKGELLLNAKRGMQSDTRNIGKTGRSAAPRRPSSVITPRVVEAEVCFHHAIETARQHEAKLLELRATMSLARLWQQQGKRYEAQQRLGEIYHWFTEGVDTRDVQEAKTVLAELARERQRAVA